MMHGTKRWAWLVVAALTPGCWYGGVAVQGDRAVVVKNDNFLFGAFRKVYVCRVTEGGLTSCQTAESP